MQATFAEPGSTDTAFLTLERGRLRGLASATLCALALGALVFGALRSGEATERLGESDRATLFVVVGVVMLAAAGFRGRTSPEWQSLGRGAAGVLGLGLAGEAVSWWVAIDRGTVGAGPGVLIATLTPFIAAVVVGLRPAAGREPGEPGEPAGFDGWRIAVIGGSSLAALGSMLPVGDGPGFGELNFGWDPPILQLAWFARVALFGFAGLAVLLDRSERALWLALGGALPAAVLALASVSESSDDFLLALRVNGLVPLGSIIVVAALVGVRWIDARARESQMSTTAAIATADVESNAHADGDTLPLEPTAAPSHEAAGVTDGVSNAPESAPAEMSYATHTWSTTQLREIRQRLAERGVVATVVGGRLQVDERARRVTDRVIAEVVEEASDDG